jgi:malonyl-CoA/methylmalonyl-CoA synthetase
MTNPLHDALFAPLADRATPLLHLQDATSISGDAFARLSARVAHALVALGLRPGDRVAAQIPKTPEALAVYAGAVAAGMVFLPLNTAYTAAEIDYFLRDSEAALLVADPQKAAALGPVANRNRTRLVTLGADGRGSLADLLADQPETFAAVARRADDLAALLYTSGTTGRSKGAMLTQDNLLSNARVLAAAWRFGPQDILLHALPIFHTHGLFVATHCALISKGSMIWLPGFDRETVIGMLPRASVMMGVPTFYTRLLEDPRLNRALTAQVRLFVSGSAPLLAATHAAFARRTGHRILERYGMTETSMSTSNPYDGERRAGTVGFPLPGVELKITDPATGAPLAVGETGMIELRGPNVFRGYWRMPEKTAEEMRADGFFITGDLGFVDADGYLHIVGRQKDMIISGGYNVYAKEIELVLDRLPGVAESAVIGVPHADLGEAVLGILVPAPGQDLDLAAIGDALTGTLARYKQPRRLFVVEALPRNAMGKVQKNVLRDAFRNRPPVPDA